METSLGKFQKLLREMFQFDCADLDFGIYRIMNHKRDAIEKFIQKTLPERIATALDDEYEQKARASAALDEMAQRVKNTLGPKAVGPDMELAKVYSDTTIGREYLKVKARAADMGDRAAVEADIYMKLHDFFSRYYQEGDFISKRRISGSRYRYAVPYNGEEVYFHWANSDQYYVKTVEHFHDYDWRAPDGSTVRFELRKADVEHNNIKGDRRFFLPMIGKMRCDGTTKKVVVPFEYRPLTPHEEQEYGKRGQQDKIVSAAAEAILNKVNALSPNLSVALCGGGGGVESQRQRFCVH